jgi:hypothetical protein
MLGAALSATFKPVQRRVYGILHIVWSATFRECPFLWLMRGSASQGHEFVNAVSASVPLHQECKWCGELKEGKDQ